ncbi:hypothetical protein K501DRAFT_286961 [Backusella circina FSU 941]|nr:hypothetical protein K501DRAFT_286961 [Backusella circina FSU 941]
MAIHSLGEFASGHSRADAEVRRALVEDTVDQFLKTEETEVPAPINAFDLLTGGNSSSNTVQKNDTSTSPTLSVTTNLVPAESKITENIPIILPDDAVNTEIKSEDFDTSFDFDDIDMDELPNTAAAGFQQQQQQNGNPAPPPSRPIHTPASAQPAAAPIQDNTAQLVEQIKCKGCGKDLISGFAKDRTFIPNVHQFSFLSHYANNTPTLIELNRPGSWIVQDKNLAGGPLSTDLLPLKYKAQVDRQDKLCLRLLTCQCDVSIGVVICDILDGGNRKDMGRVFLWESVVQIATRKPIVVMPHVRNVLDRESEYIPSSQSTNMNDMFYNLP